MATWEKELRLFININLGLDNKRPSTLLGTNGKWVREHAALRKKEMEDSGTNPKEGEYAEQMDQWLVFVVEKTELQSASRQAKNTREEAAQYRETQRMQFSSDIILRPGDRGNDNEEEESEDEEIDWPPSPPLESHEMNELIQEDEADSVQMTTEEPLLQEYNPFAPTPMRTPRSQSRGRGRGRGASRLSSRSVASGRSRRAESPFTEALVGVLDRMSNKISHSIEGLGTRNNAAISTQFESLKERLVTMEATQAEERLTSQANARSLERLLELMEAQHK